jgi:hypothetical protein
MSPFQNSSSAFFNSLLGPILGYPIDAICIMF